MMAAEVMDALMVARHMMFFDVLPVMLFDAAGSLCGAAGLRNGGDGQAAGE